MWHLENVCCQSIPILLTSGVLFGNKSLAGRKHITGSLSVSGKSVEYVDVQNPSSENSFLIRNMT